MQTAPEQKPKRMYCATDIHNAEVGDIFTHCTAPLTPYIVIYVSNHNAYDSGGFRNKLYTKILYIPLCEFFNDPNRQSVHFYDYLGINAPEFDVHCDITKVFKENFKIDKSLINKHYRRWSRFLVERKLTSL